jgi:two-component system, response regulator RegA
MGRAARSIVSEEALRSLVVDDDVTFADRLGAALTRRGHEVGVAYDHDGGLRVATTLDPQRAVLDLRMPGPSGLELLGRLREQHEGVQVVVLTGYGSIATAVDAMRLGAVGFLQKPVDTDGILAAFERSDAPTLQPTDPAYAAPSLAKVEWDHIQRVLSDCGGNVTKAARLLGMHRRTLQRKLNQYAPRS